MFFYEKTKNIEVFTSLLAVKVRMLKELIEENIKLNLDKENSGDIKLKF
ncbi:hypothetical protein [Borreliella garinii]|nr:hypothetical protein [Borreliella garinii]